MASIGAGCRTPIAAFTAAPSADHAWSTYHGARSRNPLVLTVGGAVSSIWAGHLDSAIADGNSSRVLSLTKVEGGTSPKNCKPRVGRIEVCSECYGFTGWLGIAQIWVSGGHITQAITRGEQLVTPAQPAGRV